jgi:hypothetical protein
VSKPDQEALFKLLGEVNSLLESTPEGAAIFTLLREGKIDDAEAAIQLAEVARKGGLLAQLKETSDKANALLPGGHFSPDLLKGGRPVQMTTSTGISQLNPVFEAGIAERVSLDGDAPELRSGPLPEGEDYRPAVPVVTTSMDAVQVGMMLGVASQQVKKELVTATMDHRALCLRLLETAEVSATDDGRDVNMALELTKKHLPLVPTGVPGYEAGKLPKLRTMPSPTPLEVAALPAHIRRAATYTTLATTQGRVSAAPVIEVAVMAALLDEGVHLVVGLPTNVETFSWTCQVYGAGDLADSFNPIAAAIDKLAADCLGVALGAGGSWALQVLPMNNGISERSFGWMVRIGPAESP